MATNKSENNPVPAQEYQMIIPDLRPTYSECALMSNHAYKGKAIQPKETIPGAPDWVVENTIEGPGGLFAVVYLNERTKHVAVSFRGTDNLSNLFEDLRGVVLGSDTAYQRKVFEIVNVAANMAKEKNWNLLLTGHSLGGDSAVRGVYYCHSALDFKNVHAVVFECPGSISSLRKLEANHRAVDPTLLDIVGFVSYPDLVNTFDQHAETLFSLETNLGDWGNWPGIHLKAAHTITNMVDHLTGKKDRLQSLYISDWPIGSQRKIFFDARYFKDGKYIKSPEEIAQENKHVFEEDSKSFKDAVTKKFDTTYKGHYHVISSISGNQALPLRHFSSQLQDVLCLIQTLLINSKKNDAWRDEVTKRLQEQKIPADLFNYLFGGYQIIQMSTGEKVLQVLLPGMDIHTFRKNLSTMLSQSGFSIMQLLQLAQQPPEHLVKVVVDVSGEDNLGLGVNAPTDGKSEKEIDQMIKAWKAIQAGISEIHTSIKAERNPDGTLGPTPTGNVAIGVHLGTDPVKEFMAKKLAKQQQKDRLLRTEEPAASPSPASSSSSSATPKPGSITGNE